VKIDNSGTLEQFEGRVEREWKRLLKRNEESGTKRQAARK
jgi:hypothetical protein